MAAVKPFVLVALCACSDLQGFGGPQPPLVTFDMLVTGDLGSVRPPDDTGTPNLHVALVWGRQWLVEPLCILPPENADAAAVIAAGCRDPFGFVPNRVAGDVPITLGSPATIALDTLPTAAVMVGDLTARVAYGSFIVYDDKDANGTLSLARPNRPPTMGDNRPGDVAMFSDDIVYGASMISMTLPDQRVAYREGVFIPSAFYPRAGCSDPPPAFSLLSAGGFTAQAALDATLAGTLPLEDAATCATAAPADATVTFVVQPPAQVNELRCTERSNDSSVRYRDPVDPEGGSPDLTGRTIACVHTPTFGPPSTTIELVVSGLPTDSCVGLTHYTLKGCTEGPDCGSPDWDHSDAPPSWWPC
jgi:hypothetical protein